MSLERACYRIAFEPFVNEVHLTMTGPGGKLRAEMSLSQAHCLLGQLVEAIDTADEWQPTAGLAGLLE